ncbi:unnamed protein product [Protopolystoma xenopodis]|uniref:PARG helical domain-containing protein n=1 Tax=Protopolystoma xenopodis TaxID=117903 RepID=A0A3S5ADJ5_9PLAT|nr:unnamed protein product [Protopolystoma xenopodis]
MLSAFREERACSESDRQLLSPYDYDSFGLWGRDILARKREKLRCILHYFARVSPPASVPTGTVTFTRRVLSSLPDWVSSQKTFETTRLHVNVTGSIEEAGPGTVQT